jgi:hypothetical protein
MGAQAQILYSSKRQPQQSRCQRKTTAMQAAGINCSSPQQSRQAAGHQTLQEPHSAIRDEKKTSRQGSETEARAFFLQQQMPQLRQSTRQQRQLQCKLLAKIAQHLREANKWWSTRCHRSLRIAVCKENKQAGREVCSVTIFGEPRYFGDYSNILGTAPHGRWQQLDVNNRVWINE